MKSAISGEGVFGLSFARCAFFSETAILDRCNRLPDLLHTESEASVNYSLAHTQTPLCKEERERKKKGEREGGNKRSCNFTCHRLQLAPVQRQRKDGEYGSSSHSLIPTHVLHNDNANAVVIIHIVGLTGAQVAFPTINNSASI